MTNYEKATEFLWALECARYYYGGAKEKANFDHVQAHALAESAALAQAHDALVRRYLREAPPDAEDVPAAVLVHCAAEWALRRADKPLDSAAVDAAIWNAIDEGAKRRSF